MDPFLSFLVGVWIGKERRKNSEENSYKTSNSNISEKKQEYQKKESKETQRPVGKLCKKVFDDEDKNMDKQDVWVPRTHYHNDTRGFSKREPRRHYMTPGKLCKKVFDEDYEKDYEEKGPVLKKTKK